MHMQEQKCANWDWQMEMIKKAGRPIKVLNLFAYTGGATVACAAAGAEVCHVDASKGMVTWAKENLHTSGLGDRKVRFIVDDVVKFVEREIRRGNKYDAIIMDPPSYGRGPKGEVWQIEDKLYGLVELCTKVLDYLYKNKKTNMVSVVRKDHKEAKNAELSYETLENKNGFSLVEIDLKTGRPHQIRVQFASRRHPLFGDQRYGQNVNKVGQQISLWSYKIEIEHPTTKEKMEFVCEPPK